MRSGNPSAITSAPCTPVSRPTTSIRYAGPIGQPNFSMTLSTWVKSAPCLSNKSNAPKYGNKTRLTKKPGQSLTTTGTLPIFEASATVVAMASSEDFSPRITSTSGMRWTGLKKCIPTKFSGRSSASARNVIEIVEVFDARMQSSFTSPSTSFRTARFTFGFSTTASITISVSLKSP